MHIRSGAHDSLTTHPTLYIGNADKNLVSLLFAVSSQTNPSRAMASRIIAAAVFALVLTLVLPSEVAGKLCQTYKIPDPNCPSVDACVAKCTFLHFHGGICTDSADGQLVCLCTVCNDGNK
ncbi:hypothetical protein BRADI_2g12605v3 [Brachypodium distachyon]|uniref:Uncharacterized protein n=1 Tax=Brachypodium distachyon TaxID=15368 RepID=A0A0Q3K0J3_BRADI|nr:hypothetical protein BRADI_2g12605v3 [Brachypodium distachyon]